MRNAPVLITNNVATFPQCEGIHNQLVKALLFNIRHKECVFLETMPSMNLARAEQDSLPELKVDKIETCILCVIYCFMRAKCVIIDIISQLYYYRMKIKPQSLFPVKNFFNSIWCNRPNISYRKDLSQWPKRNMNCWHNFLLSKGQTFNLWYHFKNRTW